ncbi:hypothetical protein AAFF_G00287700 [Aldrovandia affinis]|uniref:Uncharacterized protein n=1 Tax=Aldrovandia affinis TaxID=143900 RepID=A0AAD7SQL5_9TELE|nr:hypothetical protein AAFF_G00287700 [Aldrovandia affinis]
MSASGSKETGLSDFSSFQLHRCSLVISRGPTTLPDLREGHSGVALDLDCDEKPGFYWPRASHGHPVTDTMVTASCLQMRQKPMDEKAGGATDIWSLVPPTCKTTAL